MSWFTENISLKIKTVQHIYMHPSKLHIAARPYHALVYRCSGNALFHHGEDGRESHTGNLLYMPADYDYYVEYFETNELYSIHFDSDLRGVMQNYHLYDSQRMFAKFQMLNSVWEHKQEGYYYNTMAGLCEILENNSVNHTERNHNETREAFERGVQMLNAHYQAVGFGVKDAVRRANMSDTYFRKLFFLKFNTTPQKYLLSKRIAYAEKLLSTGQYSVSNAALLSGFADVKYFSCAVKKEYGVPPSFLYKKL